MGGKILYIFIASNAGEPMREVPKVMAIEGLGLEGDRYTGERGISSKLKHGTINHVSLIEQEAIDRANLNSAIPFLPQDARRNIVVKGISLNDLVGREFWVWGVKMRGVELCDPCKRPSKLCGKPGFKELFSGFGGLRAEVLTSGPIFAGANISTKTYKCLICGTTTSFPHVCPEFYPELK